MALPEDSVQERYKGQVTTGKAARAGPRYQEDPAGGPPSTGRRTDTGAPEADGVYGFDSE